ncbi:MAG: hypothetical protein ACFFD4_34375 [Candidatus Odinarchaeota archaeon]
MLQHELDTTTNKEGNSKFEVVINILTSNDIKCYREYYASKGTDFSKTMRDYLNLQISKDGNCLDVKEKSPESALIIETKRSTTGTIFFNIVCRENFLPVLEQYAADMNLTVEEYLETLIAVKIDDDFDIPEIQKNIAKV